MSMKRYRKSGKWRARTDIPALEKAGKDAARLQEAPDEDWSHIGQVISRILNKLLERYMDEESIRLENCRQKKRGFYTSAEASAKDD